MNASVRTAKTYIYKNHFKGLPTLADFKLVDEALRSLNDNEYLAEAKYIQVSIYSEIKLNTVPRAIQLARIVESKNKNFSVGNYVIGEFGWRTHTIVNDTTHKNGEFKPHSVPDIGNLPQSLALGVLGLPGNAAYFGLLEMCKPNNGDVVVISSAAGAVGSCVGQIAKIKGCKIIGITSSDEKCSWLNELGFDHCINYNNDNIAVKLREYAPDGVDCYFDNVGGKISSDVIYQMKRSGRICICGATALYYNENVKAYEVQSPIKINQVTMEGMHVTRWIDRWLEGIQQNLQWLQENKLKYKETIVDKFENTSQTFIDILEGKHFGNVIIQV